MYGNPIGNFINDFIFSLKYTLLGIFLPYSFASLVINYKNHRTEILKLKKQIPKSTENKFIDFRDDKGKIRFSLRANDLLMLESTDNYVSVFYLNKEKVQRKLLRNTLKNLEEEFKNKKILRCHRSFMVNTNNIEFIQREGKKMAIHIKQVEQTIPVSIKYSSLFFEFLS
jgi:DNA-binding LytR/AlgR family response regulator